MTACRVQQEGRVELLFYGELNDAERRGLEDHVAGCAECRRALDDLAVIAAALAVRPDVSAPAGGDWTGFMSRLSSMIAAGPAPGLPASVTTLAGRRPRPVRSSVGYVAMAALLVLVTLSVAYLARSSRAGGGAGVRAARAPLAVDDARPPAGGPAWSVDAAFASLSEQHFGRSKLVVLGLANKEPGDAADWEYERQLAAALLSDTRLYRQAAEGRGLTKLARIMDDLELVLLQASLVEQPEPEALEQIQRLIRKRDLVTKMDVVSTVAGL